MRLLFMFAIQPLVGRMFPLFYIRFLPFFSALGGILCLLLLAPVALHAKQSKDKKQKNKVFHIYPGTRWVEVKRLKPDSTEVSFKDSLFMTFSLRDSFTYRLRNGFVYTGKYTLDEDYLLDFGTRKYTLAERKYTSLVLTDADGIYYFAKDTSDTSAVIVLQEEKVLPVTNIDVMIGHWTVYKRVQEKESSGFLDPETALKSLYIAGMGSTSQMGFIVCGGDNEYEPNWFIKGYSDAQTLDIDGKSPRTLKVVKCQKGELIVQEGDMNYYCKQFK